jgi:hypothetical protein
MPKIPENGSWKLETRKAGAGQDPQQSWFLSTQMTLSNEISGVSQNVGLVSPFKLRSTSAPQ